MAKSRKRIGESFGKLRDKMLADLRSGSAGIVGWNKMTSAQRKSMGRLRRLDLSRLDLRGVKLGELDLQEAKFTAADLRDAHFGGADVTEAVFDNVKATGAWFAGIKAGDASFRSANLRKCTLRRARLLGTDFSGANLSGADLSFSDASGASFFGANLKQVSFDRVNFDEKTTFPEGFDVPDELIWSGQGIDPREVVTEPESVDIDTFLQRLAADFYAPRLKQAMKMLKADSYQLFTDIEGDSVTGVVKSQSNPDLVYSCRLDSAGVFSCCTQNLRACGGLRWALCKHLLLLIVGLMKEGQLDPTTVNAWVEASKLQRPKLDKDLMSEILIKYKGAEAGEIDWRPTETVPEDYYAF